MPAIATTTFRLDPAPDRHRLTLRGRADAREAACATLGIAAPEPSRSSSSGTLDVLSLGPDEWLLLAAGEMPDLVAPLADIPHGCVDVSDRQLGFTASGAALLEVLNAGCALDLALDAFPLGMCTRTLLFKTEIVLWRRADGMFHLEVARSFASYLLACLAEAAGHHGDTIAA